MMRHSSRYPASPVPGRRSLWLKVGAGPLFQRRSGLADLVRRVHPGERCPRHKVFRHREPADDHRLEADLLDEPLGDGERVLVVAGDRDANRCALSVGEPGQLSGTDCIEGAHAFGPAESTRSFSCSGWREENMTGWPALANSVPREPPSRPAPIAPILSGAPPPWLCASAATGEAASASSAAVLPAKCRKSRRRRSERRGALMVGISGR